MQVTVWLGCGDASMATRQEADLRRSRERHFAAVVKISVSLTLPQLTTCPYASEQLTTASAGVFRFTPLAVAAPCLGILWLTSAHKRSPVWKRSGSSFGSK